MIVEGVEAKDDHPGLAQVRVALLEQGPHAIAHERGLARLGGRGDGALGGGAAAAGEAVITRPLIRAAGRGAP